MSKRLRFEILRRDGNACRYCGATAPDVKLVIDAVVPEALGGSHKDPANLVAACEPCNSGKTSSNPDVPTVADVAQDAIRWAAAMRQAADQMLADQVERSAEHEQFAEAWDQWTCKVDGRLNQPVPKDPGWRHSVDSLRAAGLPMEVLTECITIAMGRRNVNADGAFRYMCGIAWNKVTELHGRARLMTGKASQPDAHDTGDAEGVAIDNWCRVILAQRDESDVKTATSDCLARAGDETPNGILWFVIRNIEDERSCLLDGLRELLLSLPGGIGEDLINEHAGRWRDAGAVLYQASLHATEQMALTRARQEMAMMPGDVRDAWVELAKDENADFAEHLTDVYYVTEAARLAREATEMNAA